MTLVGAGTLPAAPVPVWVNRAGLAVARAGRWTSWRGYSFLAVGIWMLCMLRLQLTSLLPLTVAVDAAKITAFAVVPLAEPENR